MAHHAYHADRAGAHIRDPEALSEGLVPAKGLLRQNVVNHHDQFIAQAIVVVEESTLEQAGCP